MAVTESELDRFVHEAVAAETVWGVRTNRGFANAWPPDDDWAAMLFWSEPAGATAAAQFEGGAAVSIALFDFLYRWLPNMISDCFCVGPNWPPESNGASVRASTLQERIQAELGVRGLLSAYRDRLSRQAAEENTGN